MVTINLEPMSKPRATRRDKWNPSKATIRYRSWADTLRFTCKQMGYYPGPELDLEFHIEMPKSWSKKKRAEMNGKPHQVKKRLDVDNLAKAFMDALYGGKHVDLDDGEVHILKVQKFWAETGKIIVR